MEQRHAAEIERLRAAAEAKRRALIAERKEARLRAAKQAYVERCQHAMEARFRCQPCMLARCLLD